MAALTKAASAELSGSVLREGVTQPSKLFTRAMLVVNNLPLVLGLFLQWLPPVTSAAIVSSVALVALIADYFKCRQRWAAGQLAQWPKAIAASFLVVNVVIFILVTLNVLSTEGYRAWSGVFMTGTLFAMSLVSSLIGRPWIYAEALEFLNENPERLESIKTPQGKHIFEKIMSALTNLWTVTFLLMTLGNIVGGILSLRQQKTAATVVNIAVPLTLVLVAQRYIQPRITERVKAAEISRMASSV